MRFRNRLQLVLVVVGAVLLGTQTMAAQAPVHSGPGHQTQAPKLLARYPRYHLHCGDSFHALFPFSPSFNQTLLIEPDGYVSLRDVGYVHVAGLTLPQVQSLLEKKYSSILKDPVITITPQSFEPRYFIATGQVEKPGKYQLRGPTTLVEAIAIAGGLSPDRANPAKVVLFPREGRTLGHGQVIDLKKMLKHKNLAEDIYVHPGDVIYVPESRWSKFHSIFPSTGMGMNVSPNATY